MSPPLAHPPAWSTSCFGAAPHPSAHELALLGAHLDLCRHPHRRLFALVCAAERFNVFVAARVISTALVLVLLLAGVLSLAG